MLSNRKIFEVNLHEDDQKAMSEILKIGTSVSRIQFPSILINPLICTRLSSQIC